MDLRAIQEHQEAGNTDRTFQDLSEHVQSSYEEYVSKGGGLVGDIDGDIH